MNTISVIIPCYRQGRYLREAVDSALNQAPPVQVVVVNDGSDDETDEVAKSYGERITYISQSNRGLPGARNAGIDVAHGRYLLFLDADDRLHAKCLDRMLSAMEGRDDRLVVGAAQHFSEDQALKFPSANAPATAPLMAGLSPAAALLVGNISAPCTFLCSARAARSVGLFDESMRYTCEDWDFWIRLVLSGIEVVAINQIVGLYRRHAMSMSNQSRVRLGEATVAILRRNYRDISGSARTVADQGGGRAKVRHAIRLMIKKELLDLAFVYRRDLAFHAAIWACIRALPWGSPRREELVEGAKTLYSASRSTLSKLARLAAKREAKP